MTRTTRIQYEPGEYLVDEGTRQKRPLSPAWTGRVQLVLDGGRVLLVTHTGYEWPARPENLREATAAERAAYDAARRAWLRAPITGVRP